MIELLLLYSYGFLFSLLIYKAPFFKRFGIKAEWLVIAFIIKIVVGILYGYLHMNPYEGGDTWALFRQGTYQVYNVLFVNPVNYLKLVFLPCSFPPPAGLEHYARSISNYGDEGDYSLIRFHAIIRLISFGYYNVHVLFYNFISFTGILFLVRFVKHFTQGKDILILAALTIFPGVSFWTSGMHKDGFALAALGVLLYCFLQLIENRFKAKHIIALALSLGLVIVLRGFILFVLVPGLLGLAWYKLKPGKAWLKFSLTQMVYYAIILNLHYIIPPLNVLQRMAFMQQQFLGLVKTNSTLNVPVLKASIIGFICGLPHALIDCMLRPFPWELRSSFLLVCLVDNTLLILLTIIVVLFLREKKPAGQPFACFCIFYALSLFAVVGAIVSNLGALVRYKNTGMLFWLLLLIYMVDWEGIKTKFNRKGAETLRRIKKIFYQKIKNAKIVA